MVSAGGHIGVGVIVYGEEDVCCVCEVTHIEADAWHLIGWCGGEHVGYCGAEEADLGLRILGEDLTLEVLLPEGDDLWHRS